MKAFRAAVLAATLGACTAMPPKYDSIETILAYPQNYEGCIVTVRGDPEVVGRIMPGGNRVRLLIHISQDGKALKYEGTFDRPFADKLVEEFSGTRKWVFKGTYVGSTFYAQLAERTDRRYVLPQSL